MTSPSVSYRDLREFSRFKDLFADEHTARMIAADLFMHGRAAAEIRRTADGHIVAICPMDPTTICCVGWMKWEQRIGDESRLLRNEDFLLIWRDAAQISQGNPRPTVPRSDTDEIALRIAKDVIAALNEHPKRGLTQAIAIAQTTIAHHLKTSRSREEWALVVEAMG